MTRACAQAPRGQKRCKPILGAQPAVGLGTAPSCIQQFFGTCAKGSTWGAKHPLAVGDAAGDAAGIVANGKALMADWSPSDQRKKAATAEEDELLNEICRSTPSGAACSSADAGAPSQQPPEVLLVGDSPSHQQPPPEDDDDEDGCPTPVAKKLRSEVNTELEGMSSAQPSMPSLPADLMGMTAVASAADMAAVSACDFNEQTQDKLLDRLAKVLQSAEHVWGEAAAGNKSEENKVNEMKSAVDTGVFDMRKHIGQKFYDDHKPGSGAHTDYQALKSREAKREFRASWAAKTYGNLIQSKTHSQSFRKVSKDSGVYRPLGAIIIKEGGWNDPAAISGSKRLAMKCCLMGGQWVSRNPLTERLEFFHLRREVSDEMAEA